MQDGLRLFGTPARSRVLLVIALLARSYPREIARVSGVPLMSAQRIVNDLERQGVVSSRLQGNQREVRLNPSYFAFVELRTLLVRLALTEPLISQEVESLRRRPRRAGKEIA